MKEKISDLKHWMRKKDYTKHDLDEVCVSVCDALAEKLKELESDRQLSWLLRTGYEEKDIKELFKGLYD